MKFIFDLDGTLTKKETLPLLAEYFGVENEINTLTNKTIKGDVPFVESFIKRVSLLSEFQVSEIDSILAKVELFEKITDFIQVNADDCIIATGNLGVWVESLVGKLGCRVVASDAVVKDGKVSRLNKIIKKEELVSELKEEGEFVVYVGDGNNDAFAMAQADISIACGLVHFPANSVMQVANFSVFDENAMVRLLKQISGNDSGKTVVISCAGIGSRMGLGQTKALLDIGESSMIGYQLKQFTTMEDIRVVVGFQYRELIQEVVSIRGDVVFAHNHDYFHTKTGASLYLGAKFANRIVLAWDGDLIVKPSDLQNCLLTNKEFIGCSPNITDDAYFVQLDDNLNVTGFTKEIGQYEWSGPAQIARDKIFYTEGHVFEMLEHHLPVKANVIEAQDVDTYDDYLKAKKKISLWASGNKKIHGYYERMEKGINTPLATRNKAKDFSRYDIEFMSRFVGKDKTLLDLGSGTGLLINGISHQFLSVTAVEKFEGFSKFIKKANNVEVINDDILDYQTSQKFSIVSLFGVLNFFNTEETVLIYRKAFEALEPGGSIIVKHQMGCKEDVLVDGYSEELSAYYYSEYRGVEKEKTLLEKTGFANVKVTDIYPAEYNRWDNTHFFALVGYKPFL